MGKELDQEGSKHQEISEKKYLEGCISAIPSAVVFYALKLTGLNTEFATILAVLSGVFFYFLVAKYPILFKNKFLYLISAIAAPAIGISICNYSYLMVTSKLNSASIEKEKILKNDAANYDIETTGSTVTGSQVFDSAQPEPLQGPVLVSESSISEFGFNSPRSNDPITLKVKNFPEGGQILDVEAGLTKGSDPANGMFMIKDSRIKVSHDSITITPGQDWGVYSLFLTGKCKTDQNAYKLLQSIPSHVTYSKERLNNILESKRTQKAGVIYDRESLVFQGLDSRAHISFLHGLTMKRPYSLYLNAVMLSVKNPSPDIVFDLLLPNGLTISFRNRVSNQPTRGFSNPKSKTFIVRLSKDAHQLRNLRINFDGSNYSLENFDNKTRINLGNMEGSNWSDLAGIAVSGSAFNVDAIAIGTYTSLSNVDHQYSIEDRM